jgi:hypothetical protein
VTAQTILPSSGKGPTPTTPRTREPLAVGPDRAAELLSISRDLFDREVLPHLRIVRVGRRVIVPIVELQKFLDRHAAMPLTGELGR